MDFQTLNLLYRCSRIFSHGRIRSQGLSDTECMICSYVYSNPGCTQDEAAQALKIDKTTIAKAMMTLEQKNCILRTQDTEDRRKKRLTVTSKGVERITGLMNLHDGWLTEILSCLTPAEQQQFENCCERLLLAAEALAEKQTSEEQT